MSDAEKTAAAAAAPDTNPRVGNLEAPAAAQDPDVVPVIAAPVDVEQEEPVQALVPELEKSEDVVSNATEQPVVVAVVAGVTSPTNSTIQAAVVPAIVETPVAAADAAVPVAVENGAVKLENPVVKSEQPAAAAVATKSNFQDSRPPLTAVDPTGKHSTVKVILEGMPYYPGGDNRRISLDGSTRFPLGQDGNQYYCQVCGEFGNVVCCDGCPRVYHQECIPVDTASRKSLDNDDDPWYCPECIVSKKGRRQPSRRGSEKGDRRSSSKRCVDCTIVRADLSLEPCGECGNYVHYPPCIEADGNGGGGRPSKRVLCSTCRAVDALTQEEDDVHETKERSLVTKGLESDGSDDMGQDGDEEMDGQPGTKRGRPKRKRSTSLASENGSDKKIKKRKKKKKKQRKRSRGDSLEDLSLELVVDASLPVVDSSPQIRRRVAGLVHATPGFYFYLAENRWKIERVLARKHRTFNRLPKGDDRNEHVAKEAALWWIKLRPTDHRRYMNMSMRDFEHRILEWKEEKNLRGDAVHVHVHDNEGEGEINRAVIEPIEDVSAEDERLTLERHERLYLGTSVGSKPFKAETNESYNRVLLDLLHDARFHPLPMLNASRTETDAPPEELNAKITIPYFDVHGPVSTSVGDECLGCSRGWAHYCPVLQRRIPFIEHRAKLQPPLSSLVATRVGLGLRPRLERMETPDEAGSETHEGEDFIWQETSEIKELKSLPVLPSSSLSEPSERADDIVQFIEEAMAMKVPEPPLPGSLQATLISSGNQGASGQRRKGSQRIEFNKCGRCRTIIENDTGCVQCRRAQLVINMSKRQPGVPSKTKGEGDNKMLKVHAAMLGRVQMKEGSGEIQSQGDQAISNAIMKMRWTPSTILPPQSFPTPSRRVRFDAEQQDKVEFDEESQQSTTSVDLILNFTEANDMNVPVTSAQDIFAEGGNGDDHNGYEGMEDQDEARPRSARLVAAASHPTVKEVWEPAVRQKVLEQNRKEAGELQKRTTSIACCGIILALMRRDPLLLFAEPVAAEGYSAVVKNPIDFGKIRANVLDGKYNSLSTFASDARLLCENALAYNPPGSIYAKTAEELIEVLGVMQKRAIDWMGAIKDAQATFVLRVEAQKRRAGAKTEDEVDSIPIGDDPFDELRKQWPEAVEMLEEGEWLRSQVEGDFMRTKENETAYYGSLAIRRVAAAAEASLAPYSDSGGVHGVVAKRSHAQDAGLRLAIDAKVAGLDYPVQLKDVTTWREESVIRFMRKVQSRRLERLVVSGNGCARCDGLSSDQEMRVAMNSDAGHWGKNRKHGESDVPRVDTSRVDLTTGLASANTSERIEKRHGITTEAACETVNEACVSVRGSRIHGWGLYADQPFAKGDVVAEYIGEYVGNSIADAREKHYQDQRIQDYQFRLDDKHVIDATMKGGLGRYINHNCSPSCFTKIIPGKEPDTHLKRVMIIAQRDIGINEEITYDYQFPLELNLAARIPCNCQSDKCRGFMNWDLPETGSNNRALLVQKRGANMRDRIRRLGRPLKRDEV